MRTSENTHCKDIDTCVSLRNRSGVVQNTTDERIPSIIFELMLLFKKLIRSIEFWHEDCWRGGRVGVRRS